MEGMDRATGKALSGTSHIQQSIEDILTTPIGSRVMRRDYGSRLFELTDSAIGEAGKLALIAATADAIHRWEPRVRVESVMISMPDPGHIEITLTVTVNGQTFTLETISL